jgi:hypothetical protein
MRGAGIPSSLIGIGIGFYGTCWGPPITQPVQASRQFSTLFFFFFLKLSESAMIRSPA